MMVMRRWEERDGAGEGEGRLRLLSLARNVQT